MPGIKKTLNHPSKRMGYEIYPKTIVKPSISGRIAQSFAWNSMIFLMVFLLVILPSLFVYAAFAIPWTRYFIALYCAWIVYDKRGPFQGRKSDRFIHYFRFNPIWDHLAGYFSAQLIKTAEIDPSRKYIIGYHPHGILD